MKILRAGRAWSAELECTGGAHMTAACDIFGRCLTCGQQVMTGGCLNLRCPAGPVRTTVVSTVVESQPIDRIEVCGVVQVPSHP